MALDGLRARLDQMLADLARTTDAASSSAGLFEALVEIKAALGGLRDALAATERELARERQQLEDAERRGRLAAEIPDQETVELAYAERQQAEMTEAYRKARLGLPQTGESPAAGATATEGPADREAQDLDYRARQALVQEQLAHLKKKLGRQD